jgi:YggT family protein
VPLAAAAIDFLFFVADAILGLLILAIIINAVLSWLFVFDVINYRNRFVAQLANTLDRIVGPMLAPLRRIIPPLGGLDLTPIVAWIVISGIRSYLLPAAKMVAMGLVYPT